MGTQVKKLVDFSTLRNQYKTNEQVKKLVDLSGLENEELKRATAFYIIKNGITRPIETLIQLVGHPCSQEQIEKHNGDFKKKYQRYEQEGLLNEKGLVKTNKEELIDSYAQMLAPIIGEGFDIAFKENLKIDPKTGQVSVTIDRQTGGPDSRFLKCASAQISTGIKSSESDPYKGSQQGLGKKTHKRKHKNRKTLRRRKVRRNVH